MKFLIVLTWLRQTTTRHLLYDVVYSKSLGKVTKFGGLACLL